MRRDTSSSSAFIFCIGLCLALLFPPWPPSAAQEQDHERRAAALIKKTLEEVGTEAARASFDRILGNREDYVFDEDEFLDLGNVYLKAGKLPAAAAVLEMASEAFPQSISALRLLAKAYFLSGDEERSLKTAAKMISVRGKAELADFLEKQKKTLASTAEEVIDRCLAATGGRDRWEAVRTMVQIIRIQSTAGNQPRMVRMYKRPLLFRQGAEGGNNFMATDGKTVWNVRDGNWQPAEFFTHRFGNTDNWLINYEELGIDYAFLGFDHINGSPVYRLRRTYPDGGEEDCYFSALSNLLTEIRSDYVQGTPFMKSFMSLWNYREVEGVKIPFVFIRNMGPLEPPHGGIIEEVRINVPLDDSLFLPPGYEK